MAEPLRVVVTGATGKMSRQVLAALCADPETVAVGAVSTRAETEALPLPDGSGKIPLQRTLEALLAQVPADAVVDFTTARAVVPFARTAAAHGAAFITGTSGLGEAELAELETLSHQHGVGLVVAPNFALGAVLMSHLAALAGRYFDFAELVEAHHEQKIDAPSGTALAMARAIVAARGRPFQHNTPEKLALPEARGGDLGGIGIHSLRLPGVVADHTLIFGGLGQTLAIKHTTLSREAFMPGVLLAVKAAVREKRYIYGLDRLLGLSRD